MTAAELRTRRIELECDLLEAKVAAEKFSHARLSEAPEHNGRFTLFTDVSEGSVYMLIREIDSFLARNPLSNRIELLINSGGGVVLDGLALVDYLSALRARGIFVKATGMGLCASMAGVILQAASERTMTPRAWLGIHEVQSVAAGGMSVAHDKLKWAERLQEQALDLYVSRSKLTADEIRDMWARRDVMMNAHEALEHGLIDSIEEQ